MNEKLMEMVARSIISGLEMLETHVNLVPVSDAYRQVIVEASDLVQAIIRAAFLTGEPSPEVAGKIHQLHEQFLGDK